MIVHVNPAQSFAMWKSRADDAPTADDARQAALRQLAGARAWVTDVGARRES